MVLFRRDSREIDRIREGRRGSTAATAAEAMNGGVGGGMSRRRPRIGSLRESPEHEEEIDGGARRDRCRNRSGRRKRRREDRQIYAGDGDEAGVVSDESVEEGDGGDTLPPPQTRRSGFHASSRYPAAWWWDDVDEIVGVPVPRKARSASRRRSRDWVSKIARPSSSPSTIQEIEMEVAEVLFGMTRHHHQLPKQESRPPPAPPTEEENLREAKVDDELASHVAPPPADSQVIDAQQAPEQPVAGSNESKEFPRQRAEDESNETEFSIAVKEEDEGRSRGGGRQRVQKQQASPAPASFLSNSHPHRLKRCATHCYVARNIYHHQQTAKLTPPPCDLNAAPSSELPGKSSNGVGKGSSSENEAPAWCRGAPMAKAMPFLNGALCPPPLPATTTNQHGQHPIPSSSSSSLKQPPLRLPLYQLRQPVSETAMGREVSSSIAMNGAAAPPRTFELSFASMNNPAAVALPPPVGRNFSAAMATHQKLPPPPLSNFGNLSEVSARLSIAAGKVVDWNPAAVAAIAKPPARSGSQLQHQSLDFSRPDSGGEKGRSSSNAVSSSKAAAPVFSFSNPLQLEEARMQDLEQVYLRDDLQRILKRQLSSPPPPPPPQLPSRDIRALMAAAPAPLTHISFGGTAALAPAAGAAGSKSAPSPAPTSTSRNSAPASGHRFMDMDSILGRPPPLLVSLASGSSSSSMKQKQQQQLKLPPASASYPQPLLFSNNNNPYMQYQSPPPPPPPLCTTTGRRREAEL